MPSTAPVTDATTSTDRPPVRVLIVDDHPTIREVLCEIVEDLGAIALTAPGYDSALALARYEPIDLLLTDVMLGSGPNGIVLAETLRAEQPDLGIVIVSAAGAPNGALRLAAQRIDYWLKPLDVERLAQRIAEPR